VSVAVAVRRSTPSAASGSIAPAITWRLAAWMMSVRIPISHSTALEHGAPGRERRLQARPQLGTLEALWVDDHQTPVAADHLPGSA
jgi:hypothetical protein